METKTETTKSTPTMERPIDALRVRSGLRAGGGGVTHTDRWDGEQVRSR